MTRKLLCEHCIAEAALVRRRVELERTHLTILGPSCCLTIPGHACIDVSFSASFFWGAWEKGVLEVKPAKKRGRVPPGKIASSKLRKFKKVAL